MKTIINIKADKEVKDQAASVAADMGLPLSTVVNAFLKQFIAERRIEFVAPYKPSPMLARVLRDAGKDIRKGKNLSPLLTTPDAIDDHLASLKKRNK
ncbi:MAG TPA: type II toxin-antitoxin system RelB/DinJ family antitoxin [Candidatus Paceibacterota bacterium]|nr:type II toxin-antitoxin system RelB/DinJ family antitoxin [Candidatus Paceibacterota bacterium]